VAKVEVTVDPNVKYTMSASYFEDIHIDA